MAPKACFVKRRTTRLPLWFAQRLIIYIIFGINPAMPKNASEHNLHPSVQHPLGLHLQPVQVLVERKSELKPEAERPFREACSDEEVKAVSAVILRVRVGARSLLQRLCDLRV